MSKQSITIVGAGLVGSLLATMLAKRGYSVQLFERRPDMRAANISAGRSINLALSDRGLRALEVAGIAEYVQRIAIPMRGRMMHDVSGNLAFQPYGVGNQAINSVSRGELNKELLTLAEKHGVQITFDARCTDIDFKSNTIHFVNDATREAKTVTSDIIFGADGAFSAVRGKMQITDRFDYSQSYLPHNYKELHIPSDKSGEFMLEKHALHIWPRHAFMMIALPNIDGSFTCTLFLAHEGTPSFSELKEESDVVEFFEKYFPDVIPLMPTLVHDFFANPEPSLVTVKCSPWVMNNSIALIGDAAHAIVPFYGQGMNCGFEDCRVLLDCLDATSDDWSKTFVLYEQFRKQDGNAIADLAVENFVEMRDKVADDRFLRRKKIEAFLHQNYPTKFIPQYTLVTFSPEVPYSEAQRVGRSQDVLMEQLLSDPGVYEDWTTEESMQKVQRIMDNREQISFKSISPLPYQ